MALQSLQITTITAMRARDVSRPDAEHQEAADRRPLRDETPRKAETPARRSEAQPPRRKPETRRRGG
ncbi:hypothetical protein GCM10009677_47560 [Sphaerisporangium rubeum]|uniref:Uncharacterized protein n=1 Tax=Sphaerisporangium rubeum TaxID=321317 RepID=A0A7X0IIF9_9ACTN|nr:hypothetical protein [Sphaerisporangium rubeum]MBB6475254.1 hypothetical protein [Sphaerisporangium rubeum]